MSSKRLLAGLFSAVLLAGCGDSEQSLSEKAGKAVGEGLTGFLSGVGSSVDEQMKVQTELSEAASAAGLGVTTGKSAGMGDPDKTFTIYLIAGQPFKGTLLARAFDKDGQEIGRSRAEVDLQKDDADYVGFVFHQQMDSQLVSKYRIDLAR